MFEHLDIIELLMKDYPLQFHESLNDLLSTFRNTIASIGWLMESLNSAISFHQKYPYIVTLKSSVTKDFVKIDKSIFYLIREEALSNTPSLCSKSLIDLYRVFTIAAMDVVWGNEDFKKLHKRQELQFLRHLRNASAHKNSFYWGKGTARTKTIKNLPVRWRGKIISKKIEEKPLYFDFLAPGDLFVLLSDISALVRKG